jgi:hypothetical protein
MLQAAVCDSGQLDAFAFCEDRLRSAKVDVGRCDVFDALMIAGVIVVLDEGVDLPFEISGQIVVVECLPSAPLRQIEGLHGGRISGSS